MDDAHGGITDADERRRRASALRALARARPGSVGWSRALDGARRVFGGERELLLAAHQRWQVHLLARLDLVLEQATGDPHDDVLRAVAELGRAMPGLAALLRERTEDPAVARAQHRLAGYVDRACACGRPHPLVAPVHPVVSAPGRPLLHGLARATRRRCLLTRWAVRCRLRVGHSAQPA